MTSSTHPHPHSRPIQFPRSTSLTHSPITSAPSEDDDDIFEVLDIGFNVCFLVEAIVLVVALGFWNRPPAGTGIGLCSVRKRKTPSDSSGAKGEKVEGDGEEEDEDEVDILMRGYH